MSIASKLQKLETDISNAYDGIEIKEGTIPLNKNTENLKNAILSIPSGSRANIFIQNTQPSTFDGIWIADSNYENYPVVEVINSSSVIASSINIIAGKRYHTELFDDFNLFFYTIKITDSNNNYENVNIYYGDGTQWNLIPNDYTELEYIESTGTQWINTGLNASSDLKFILNCKYLGRNGNYAGLFGCRDSYTSCNYHYNPYDNGTTGYIAFGTNHITGPNQSLILNKDFEISVENGVFTFNVDNNTYTYTVLNYGGDFVGTQPFMIGNWGNTASDTTNIRFYSCKMYKSNVIIRDYIPVKDGNNVACLYDKVNDEFVYNAGTGDFIASVKPNTELEYIESTGTQYINTGIIPTNHYVEIKAQYTTNTNDAVLLGCSYNDFHITWFDNQWYYGIGNGQANGGGAYVCTNLNTFVYGKDNQFTINGNVIQSNINPASSYTLQLLNRPQAPASKAPAKIYYCKIYNKTTNELVRDFVPYTDNNKVVCLYDKVSDTFFYNAGTGTFIPGNEI